MKRAIVLLVTVLVLGSIFTVSASADMGPKPSVIIDIEGFEGDYYGTLLSYEKSNGPLSAYDEEDGWSLYDEEDEEYGIWKAFVDYKDSDGYFFLQDFWYCGETDTLSWTYFPPDRFKLLLYFPETGEFVSSGVYERYAFDSYYVATVEGGKIILTEDYRLSGQLLSFFARLLITFAIEAGLMLLFGYRSKKSVRLILLANAATQVLLNVWLNVVYFRSGFFAYVGTYILLELAVFAIEAIIFAKLLPVYGEKTARHAVIYAFIANLVSFGAGLLICGVIPFFA